MPSDILGGYLDVWDDRAEDDFHWVAHIMSAFTYKPGWLFDVRRQMGGIAVQIAMMAEDSRRGPNQWPSYRDITMTPGEPIRIERDDLIPVAGVFMVDRDYLCKRRDERMFLRWLRDCIRNVEMHEMDEWFRYMGELPYDPHAPDKLMEVR